MKQHDGPVEAGLRELISHGSTPEIVWCRHHLVRWRDCGGSEQLTVAVSSSDWRASRNARVLVRRPSEKWKTMTLPPLVARAGSSARQLTLT